MGKDIYKAHNLEFHKEHFVTTRGLYLYRKEHLKITQMIWIKKQPFVDVNGIVDSSCVILIHLN